MEMTTEEARENGFQDALAGHYALDHGSGPYQLSELELAYMDGYDGGERYREELDETG